MKILLIHNHYGSAAPSGENEVFNREKRLLESRSHEVRVFERHSDDIRYRGAIGLIHGGLVVPWNLRSFHQMRREVSEFRPDVIHAHNTFPLISPSVFPAARGAARVLTLHNYRLYCAAGILMRDGQVCTLCLDRHSALPAVRFGCYRGSRVATVPLALSISLHRARGTWRRDVEAYIALSEFQRDVMVAAGLPPDRVWVKPNFHPGDPRVVSWEERAPRVVYVGRLSPEKGVEDLVAAWISWGIAAPELVMIGDGPSRGSLQERIREAGAINIRLTGRASATEAQHWIATSRLLVLPSRWFEGFPLVLSEASAFGTPVLVSNLGALPGFVNQAGNGGVFSAGNPGELMSWAAKLWKDGSGLATMGASGRRYFETRLSEAVNYQALIRIYQHAISASLRTQGQRRDAAGGN